MPSIASELITYFKSITAITDLVGSGAAARIYEEDPKQGAALPYISFDVIEGTTASHLNGISGIATNRIEIRAYATTRAGSYALAEAIRLAPLADARVTMGTTLVRERGNGSYDFEIDRPQKGGNQRRYYVGRDYIFDYDEAIA